MQAMYWESKGIGNGGNGEGRGGVIVQLAPHYDSIRNSALATPITVRYILAFDFRVYLSLIADLLKMRPTNHLHTGFNLLSSRSESHFITCVWDCFQNTGGAPTS